MRPSATANKSSTNWNVFQTFHFTISSTVAWMLEVHSDEMTSIDEAKQIQVNEREAKQYLKLPILFSPEANFIGNHTLQMIQALFIDWPGIHRLVSASFSCFQHRSTSVQWVDELQFLWGESVCLLETEKHQLITHIYYTNENEHVERGPARQVQCPASRANSSQKQTEKMEKMFSVVKILWSILGMLCFLFHFILGKDIFHRKSESKIWKNDMNGMPMYFISISWDN